MVSPLGQFCPTKNLQQPQTTTHQRDSLSLAVLKKQGEKMSSPTHSIRMTSADWKHLRGISKLRIIRKEYLNFGEFLLNAAKREHCRLLRLEPRNNETN